MTDSWDPLAEWWISEGQADPSYDLDIVPMLQRLLPGPRGRVLDIGCGTGHLAEHLGGGAVGVDASERLASVARDEMPAVVARAPDLGCFRSAVFDGAVSVYLFDLVADLDTLFGTVARLVRPGGWLVVVVNHPVYTAPGSAPIMDVDGEVLWRWGTYFTEGSSVEPAGPGVVRFEHRPTSIVMRSAAMAGWVLEDMVEAPLGEETIGVLPGYAGQDMIPRLLGVRWIRGA